MLDQYIREALRGGHHVAIVWDNGARLEATHCSYAYVKYNTGDQIWLTFEGGEYKITQIEDASHNVYDF
jgi:hypothetical protein